MCGKEKVAVGAYDIFKTPYKIGKVEIPNRFAVIPMTLGALSYDEDGGFSENFIHYFELRAQGGFGLLIPGAIATDAVVDPYSALGPVPTVTPGWARGARELTDRVHKAGSKIFAQISMGLGRNYPGLPSPSENYVWKNGDMKSPVLTTEQIQQKIKGMIDVAKIAKDCGYDGIELHAMHWGYLLDQLGMSFFNRREDQYGGSLENRLRAAKEICEGIKEVCGEDFPVGMRLGLKSYLKDNNIATLTGEEEAGRTLAEGVAVCKLLESYGFDFLDVDTGTYDSFYYACPPMYMPQGFMIDLAAKAKEVVNIPIIAGGRMQDYDKAKDALEKGLIDAVGIGRASLADPDYAKKLYDDTPERIRPCIGCNMGCFRRCCETGEPVSCAVNPQAARETVNGLKPADGKKKVVVVGGGVSGMEAARVCALRGYDVTLFEQSDHLGGHLAEAGAHSFKSEIAKLAKWYERELSELNITIKLEHAPCVNCIRKENPDAIVFATGSVAAAPPIDGLEKAIVSLDAIEHPEKIGKNVVVVGGGLVGCEIALDEAKHGKNVTVVEALDDIMSAGGASAPYPNYQMICDLFDFYGVKVLKSTKLVRVTDAGAVVENADGQVTLPADTVVSALGFKPTENAEESYKELGVPIYSVGDSKGAATILNAVWTAYDVANEI
ncbi:MAG: FAD-dependent oxidoreductase [Lachnospiraceae bacterium]|nr:FAD-dependent oxidoreductase [Lachnospiraceae bacterium]